MSAKHKLHLHEAERLWTFIEQYRSLLPYNVNDVKPMKRRFEIFNAQKSQDRRALITAVDIGRQEALNSVQGSLESRER